VWKKEVPGGGNTVILFIEKTWFLWWMLAIVVALRWFHLVSSNVKLQGLEALPLEEEEAYVDTWQVLRKGQVISLFNTESAN
jgi:hypothetical protein